jgi:hypothetical protein
MARYLCVVVVLGLVPAFAGAAEPPARTQLPAIEPEKHERTLFDQWEMTPLSTDAVATIERWREPLQILHKLVKLDPQNWLVESTSVLEGKQTDTPSHIKARVLARAAVLSARLYFEQNQPTAALAELDVLLTFSRQIDQDRSLLAWLAAQNCESIALRCLALHLARVDQNALKAFQTKWSGLSKLRTTKQALRGELDLYRQGFQRRGLDFLSEGKEKEMRIKILELHGSQSEKEVVASYKNAVSREFARLEKIVELPIDEIEAADKKLAEDLKSNAAGDGPFVRIFLGQVLPSAKLKKAELRHDLYRAMFRSIIEAKIAGRALPEPPVDPFSGKPCKVEKTAEGYELKTHSSPHLVEPVTLRVRTAMPKPPQTP